jgi:hypothetical protein
MVILHPETGIAYSRNSLPSPRGRPSALLLDRALSERAGGLNVMYKSIAVFLRLQLPASLLALALLTILRLALVCVQTSAALAHPSRNFSPLLVKAPTASNSSLLNARSMVSLALSPHLGT